MLIAGASPARAEERVIARVPFDFVVGSVKMPAGRYVVTEGDDPALVSIANANVPLDVTDRLSPPSFCSTTVPTRPLTDPPIVYFVGVQLIETLVTFAPPTVPEPPETVHV